MTTNAKRQAAYRERMRKAGYQQVLIWIQPEFNDLLNGLAERIRKADSVELLSIRRMLSK